MNTYRFTTNRTDGVKHDFYVNLPNDTEAFKFRAAQAARVGKNFTVSFARVTLDEQHAENTAG